LLVVSSLQLVARKNKLKKSNIRYLK